ncbi:MULTISPECIES: DmsC/YnfH family molybdoenzyme membrane anchor subunit [unclassified Adlercreutzia]|uniref:dimethyl sulfoxide reductase anchor subunit family protein n=1 Tax=unclassified Adlercreutzia TaxID=2636013 RepID=UPI0013EAD79B|nr:MULTISPECIES: DmsC/YnfH family molybdoenzyme membrane anchor subunit [unclassified Adlercreutzia]
MGNGFEHTALAVFTTLAPLGAATFVVLAAAFWKGDLTEDMARRLDKATALPVALVLVGFVAAFFHLAAPQNAVGVFAGVGCSPLSNEVLAGIVFVAIMLIYWVSALAGKLEARSGVRHGLLAVISVLAVVFAVFCGFAYLTPTIPTWNNPLSVIQLVGYSLLGGAVCGALACAIARIDLFGVLGVITCCMGSAGLVVGAVSFGGFIAACGGVHNSWGCALDAVPNIWLSFAAFVAAGLVGTGVLFAARKRSNMTVALTVALVLVIVGVFIARIGFYGLYAGLAL